MKLFDYQKEILREAFQLNPDGTLKYRTIVLCLPKRQGKSFLAAIIAAWKLVLFPNQRGMSLANSAEQAASVSFEYLRQFCKYSPFVKGMTKELGRWRIAFKNGSWIEAVPCRTETIAGRPLDLLVADELGLARDETPYQTAASQTERPGALVVVTSSAGSYDNILYRMYKAYQEGKMPHMKFIYRKGESAATMNPLVGKDWLEARKREMLPQLFRMYHLNEWGGASDALLTPEEVEACIDDRLRNFMEASEVAVLCNGFSGFTTAAALDRALPFSKHGDRTVLTVAGRFRRGGDDFFIVLWSHVFEFGTEHEIKAAIKEAWERYAPAAFIFEQYQSYDIAMWANEQGYPVKLEHATSAAQIRAFTNLVTLVRSRRLRIPPDAVDLINELKIIRAEILKGGQVRFGAPEGYNDDTVYSLIWALDALVDLPFVAPVVTAV